MEDQARDVLAALKNNNNPIDAKTTYLSHLKSDIKRENVPEGAISDTFEALRIAVTSQQSALATTGFSTLGHFLKRLYLQDQANIIAIQGRMLYPLLLDRLADHKERVRSQVAQAFTDFWQAAPADVEAYLESALVGKNPRAKETSMIWLGNMTKERGLLFRNYVPSLVACLEDADSGVRETAKKTIIDIFHNAPPKALSDLKKQLALHNVRKSFVTAILSNVGGQSEEASHSQPAKNQPTRPASVVSAHRDIGRSTSALSLHSHPESSNRHKATKRDVSKKTSPAESAEAISVAPAACGDSDGQGIEPLYVHSHRELEDMIRDMTLRFEGRESEHNWLLRENNIKTLRRLTRGNAPTDFHSQYLAGVKQLLDGIMKAVNSLRTTLSSSGCVLIQEIARTVGSGIDPFVEILMQNLMKVCSALKKITAQQGNTTVDAVVGAASYHSRIMQHLWISAQDKNTQPRQFVTGWLKTIITKHAPQSKSAIEHSAGFELIEKCIRRGLADANPAVRESMRSTFWVFTRVWQERGEIILDSMDPKSRSLIEKDPGNFLSSVPHGHAAPGKPRAAPPGQATDKRAKLKDVIAAQKKAKSEPETGSKENTDPFTAQTDHLTHDGARTASRPKLPLQRPKSAIRNATSTPTTSSSAGVGSTLSSAPLRPVRHKKPADPTSRPISTDPYTQRLDDSSRSVSPDNEQQLHEEVLREREREQEREHEREQEREREIEREREWEKEKEREREQEREREERERERQREHDRELQREHEREIQREHDRELQHEHEREIQRGHDRELQREHEREIQRGHERELQREHERELQRQLELEREREEEQARIRAKAHEEIQLHQQQMQMQTRPSTPPPASPREFVPKPSTPQTPVISAQPTTAALTPPAPHEAPASPFALRGRSETREKNDRTTNLSPRSRDPVRGRRILDHGISKVRSGTVDALGYRKIQALIRFHSTIFDIEEGLYGEALSALLSALEAEPVSTMSPSSSVRDMKTQVLATLRTLANVNRHHFVKYSDRVLVSLIKARQYYDSRYRMVTALEEMCEDIISWGDLETDEPENMVQATRTVLLFLEGQPVPEKPSEINDSIFVFGTWVLDQVLLRVNEKTNVNSQHEEQAAQSSAHPSGPSSPSSSVSHATSYQISESDPMLFDRLLRFVKDRVNNVQTEVRQVVFAVTFQLKKMVKSEELFWQMMQRVGIQGRAAADLRSLMTYYVTRESKVQMV